MTLDSFVQSLPYKCRTAVTLSIHSSVFNKHPMLLTIKSKRLLAFMGARFEHN